MIYLPGLGVVKAEARPVTLLQAATRRGRRVTAFPPRYFSPLRGKALGKAKDILVVFEQRGIDADDKSRELLESCTNLDTLNGWFRRAFKVDKASDLFAE